MRLGDDLGEGVAPRRAVENQRAHAGAEAEAEVTRALVVRAVRRVVGPVDVLRADHLHVRNAGVAEPEAVGRGVLRPVVEAVEVDRGECFAAVHLAAPHIDGAVDVAWRAQAAAFGKDGEQVAAVVVDRLAVRGQPAALERGVRDRREAGGREFSPRHRIVEGRAVEPDELHRAVHRAGLVHHPENAAAVAVHRERHVAVPVEHGARQRSGREVELAHARGVGKVDQEAGRERGIGVGAVLVEVSADAKIARAFQPLDLHTVAAGAVCPAPDRARHRGLVEVERIGARGVVVDQLAHIGHATGIQQRQDAHAVRVPVGQT